MSNSKSYNKEQFQKNLNNLINQVSNKNNKYGGSKKDESIPPEYVIANSSDRVSLILHKYATLHLFVELQKRKDNKILNLNSLRKWV